MLANVTSYETKGYHSSKNSNSELEMWTTRQNERKRL